MVAITGNLLPAVLFPLAQTHLPSSTVGTINSLTPLMTLLVGIIAYGERLRPQALLGIVLGFAGSVSLILMRSSGAGAEFDWVNLGYGGVALISSVCYGISLMECAALASLDEDVAALRAYPEAMTVIQKVK